MLVLFQLVGLSVQVKDAAAFTGFPFALVVTCTLREYVAYIAKYMNFTGIIINFGRLWNIP